MNIYDNNKDLILNTLYQKIGVYEVLIDTMKEAISLLEQRIKYLTIELEHNDKHNEVLENLLNQYEEIERSYHKKYLN